MVKPVFAEFRHTHESLRGSRPPISRCTTEHYLGVEGVDGADDAFFFSSAK